MSIILSYPWWFVLLCIAAGAAYSAGLYYRNRKNKDLAIPYRRLLAAFRFVTVTALCFLLLSPLVKNIFRSVEKPIIVIARDNSASIPINKDSSYYRNIFPGQLDAFTATLSQDYDVFTYNFGSGLSENKPYDFSEKQTDISLAVEEIGIRYINRNLGAVIVATDGLYNKGSNPLLPATTLKAPFYTIALGDTTIRRDLILSRVSHNNVVFLGNKFPVEISVDANKLAGTSTRLSISTDGKTIFEKPIAIGREDYSLTVPALLDAEKPGTRRYRIALSTIKDEVTYANNYQDIYVEVIDSRQKILILTEAPHPDIAALQQTIANNENYQSEVGMVPGFTKSLKEYSLVILYQLPSATNAVADLAATIKASEIPVIYTLGNSSSVSAFNALGTGLRITGNKNNTDEVLPVLNPAFSLFTLSETTRSFVQKLPPLISPYGSAYEITPNTTPFIYRKIGSVATQAPLIAFSTGGRHKSCIIAGEGFWKWRMYDYQAHRNHQAFDEIFNRIVQYLAVKEDKSFFRINTASQFMENEPVIIDAELYNESYELINVPDVKIEIATADKKIFPFAFSRTSNAYRINAGILPVGDYSYVASVNYNGKQYRKAGAFVVRPIQVEAVNTVADHQLLYMLSQTTGGEMVYPNQLDALLQKIRAKKEIIPVSYSQKQLKDLIHFKWIFFLLLALLSVEWFLRKRQGTY